MYLFAEQLPWNPIVPVAVLAVTACAAMWVWLVARWWRRQSIVSYQPRRPVPWHAVDLAAVLVFYLALQSGLIELAGVVLGSHAIQAPAAYVPGESTTEHMVGQLIPEGSVWVFLLCGISAVLVAPLSEEFLFRVLLQGWLEALEHRGRRKMATLRRLIPRGAGPILLTAFLFARLHFRVEGPPLSPDFLIFLLAGDAAARLLAMAFAVGWMRWRAGATAADLGWTLRNTKGDIRLGLAGFVAVAVPVYAMQAVFVSVLPTYIAPDPFPLFFFAVALGAVYYRTHRIVPWSCSMRC